MTLATAWRIQAGPEARPLLGVRSLTTWLIAGYFLYLPLANVPPMKIIRNTILQIPLADADGFEVGLHPWIVLFPDFAFALALLVISVPLVRMAGPPHWLRNLLLVIIAAFALGGGLATVASESPAISLVGLLARLGVLALAWLIASVGVTRSAARIWIYALFLGLGLILLNGLFVYLQTFGWTDDWTDLSARRSTQQWIEYGLVTWGHAANTAGIVLLTMPVAVMMLWTRRGAAFVERSLLVSLIVLMAVTILITFQRWALICVPAAAVMMLLRWRLSLRSLVLVALLLAVYLNIGQQILESTSGYFVEAATGTSPSSLGPRLNLMSQWISAIRDYPAGVGFEGAYRLGIGGRTSSHNMLIDATLEGGLLVGGAVAAWLAVIAMSLMRGISSRTVMTDAQFALILGAATYSLFGIFFNGQVYLAGMTIWFALWILLPVIALSMTDDEDRGQAQ